MTSPPSSGQPVRLSLPASPRYLSSARVVAASLGAESGLTVDEIDDLRIGVNELMSLLVEGAADDARVTLTLVGDEGTVTIHGELEGSGEAAELDELARRILAAVADSYELGTDSFRLTKVSDLLGDD